MAGCARCNEAHVPASIDASAAPSVSAAPSASAQTAASFSCAPLDPVALDQSTLGFHVTDVVDLSAAASGDRAVVTFAANGDQGCEQDGCYVFHEVFSFSIDGRVATKPTHAPTSALGVSPAESSVAFVLDGAPALLTQGHAGAAAMPQPGQDAQDTIYLVGARGVTSRSPETFSGSQWSALSLGSITYAIGAGVTSHSNGEGDGPPGVVAVRLEGARRAKHILEQGSGVFDAPVIAAHGPHIAVAWRRRTSKGLAAIFVAWLDEANATALAKPISIAEGSVGAPSMWVDTAGAHVVFAQRRAAGEPYVLMRADLGAADPRPTPASRVPIATSSALAPSVAVMGSAVLLAWMEGDESAKGRVWAGAGATLEAAAKSAAPVSDASVRNARDPEWAPAGDHAMLAWVEHDGPRRARAAWCR